MKYRPHTDVDTGEIDWGVQQPHGVWRCDRGYADTDGHEYFCSKRATTEMADGSNLCTEHALFQEIAQLRKAQENILEHIEQYISRSLDDIGGALDDCARALGTVAWNSHPWYLRLWYFLKERRRARRDYPKGTYADETYPCGCRVKSVLPTGGDFAEDESV